MIPDAHFQILGVTRNSTREEIRKAYRAQIRIWHPDKFQQQPEKLAKALEISKQLTLAFQLLKNYSPPGMNAGKPSKQKFNDSKTASMRTGKPEFHRVKVNSQKIWSVAYDPFTRILEVEFYKEGIHHYFDVPEIVYNHLRFADSVDDYLDKHISGKYRFEQLPH